jgi:hypothetical protein
MVYISSKKSIKLEDAESAVALSDQEQDAPAASEGDAAMEDDSRDASLGCNSQKAEDEEEDPIMQVMLKSIQDPDLAPIYEGLPDLG